MELDLYAEGALPQISQLCQRNLPQRILYVGDVFKFCFIFTPKIGEDEPISTDIFQMG